MKTLSVVSAFVAVLVAWQSSTGGMGVPRGDDLPAGCGVGAIYYKTGADAGLYACDPVNTWTALGGSAPTGSGEPAGIVVLSLSSCPTGYAEVASVSGKTVIGTVAANGDVTTTGGSDSLTPAGTNATATFTGTLASLTHSGTAVADHASHTHTYTDVIAHTHTIPVGATDDTAAPFDRADAGTNASGANATTASGSTGAAQGTTAGPNATLTHSVTQPSAHSYTPQGTVSAATFTGTAGENRSAFVRVIFCQKS